MAITDSIECGAYDLSAKLTQGSKSCETGKIEEFSNIKGINVCLHKGTYLLYCHAKCGTRSFYPGNSDMSNSIETAIAIAIFGTIAIGIAIAKTNSQLLILLLVLLRGFPNYCYCY